MPGLLDGKVALVTGSGANIGEACAKHLAKAGAAVIVADINLTGARRVAEEIIAAGGQASAHRVDLADEDSIAALKTDVAHTYGRLDILHNNAADVRMEQMTADNLLVDMPASVWDRAFTVNTRGTMLMIKYFAPLIAQGGGGAIINTSSGVSILGDYFNPAYAASKAAINSLTRNAATQLGGQNIRCNAILPGMILTPHSRSLMTPEQLEMLARHTLMPRLGSPEDIAATVVFLGSDAGSFITGQLLSVDGGMTVHQPYVADVLASAGWMQN